MISSFEVFFWLGLLVLVLIAIAYIKIIARQKNELFPYEKAGNLLTPGEETFYKALHDLAAKDFDIFIKVRIGDVLKVKRGLSKKDFLKFGAKIFQKHFDFVLCKKNTFVPTCCIELNDKSHNSKDRKKRDYFVRGACAAANISLYEITAKMNYSAHDLRSKLTFLQNT